MASSCGKELTLGHNGSDVNTEVCVRLNSQVQRLDANEMREVLEVVGEVVEWYLEHARNEASSVLVWKG